MKKSWIILGSTVLSLCMTGCGANDNAGGNDHNENQKVQTNQVIPRTINNDQNNEKLRISNRAEKQVEKLGQVDDAHVIISNNNAYVAVRLNSNRNNRDGNGNVNNKDNDGNAIVNDALDGNGRTLVDNGTVNRNGNNAAVNDGIIDGRNDAGNRKDDNNNILGAGNGDNNTGAGNNAGTTDSGTNYSKVSNSFEQKIADQVRAADNKIHNVYVSVNPDFYNRMNTYADDIRTDGDRNGLVDDFNNMVKGFFRR